MKPNNINQLEQMVKNLATHDYVADVVSTQPKVEAEEQITSKGKFAPKPGQRRPNSFHKK